MEWQVVTVIIALSGFAISIITPIIKLTKSITTLTVTLKQVDNRLTAQEQSSKNSHKRLWEKNEEQDEKLNDHERRITLIERK